MKRKIRFVDKINNKVTEKEIEIPNKEHFYAQLSNPSHIFKPKKGKGSFTRKQKYKNKGEYYEEK